MDQLHVGDECDAYCTTCRIMKYHTVVALVGGRPAKVECAGCHKQHAYRAQPPGTTPPKGTGAPRARKPTPPPAVVIGPPSDLAERIAGREARVYSPNDRYAVEDVVSHPTFGVGMVIALPAAQKVEIEFPKVRKLLVHDRGGASSAATLARPARTDDVVLPPPDAPAK